MEKIKLQLNNTELVELYSLLEKVDFNRPEKRIGHMSKYLCAQVFKRIASRVINPADRHILNLSPAEASAIDLALGFSEQNDNYRRNLVLKLRMIIDQKLA